MKKPLVKLVVTAGLIACAAGGAWAQTSTAPSPAPAATHDHQYGGHGHMDPAKMQEEMAKRHAQRMADFKTILRITPAQESAWTAFTTSMAPQAGQGMMHHSPEEPAKLKAELEAMNTPQRMEKMRALHAEHQAKHNAEMDRRIAAVKTFYAVLSPEQQKIFDITHKNRMAHRWGGQHQHGQHDRQV